MCFIFGVPGHCWDAQTSAKFATAAPAVQESCAGSANALAGIIAAQACFEWMKLSHHLVTDWLFSNLSTDTGKETQHSIEAGLILKTMRNKNPISAHAKPYTM